MPVSAFLIVENLNVIEHVRSRIVACPLDLFLDPLFLQIAEKGLSYRVVIAVYAAIQCSALTHGPDRTSWRLSCQKALAFTYQLLRGSLRYQSPRSGPELQ